MKPFLKRIDIRHKNSKFLYYIKVLVRKLLPASFFQSKLSKTLNLVNQLDSPTKLRILARVDYYNKLSERKPISATAISLHKLKFPKKQKTYYFDTHEYIRYFNSCLRANFLFGDVTLIPDQPTIVKSRPIQGNNANSILLNLDKFRHFNFTTDRRSFEEKRDMLVGRGVVKREHRIRFYEMYFNHPLCNLGQINRGKNEQWIRGFMSIAEHLEYKFILCLEGNDVATNLKWVMSSNSLAVMPKPKFETWFMEGTLIGDQHYVEIKDDYSDLEERLRYYINNPHKATAIINAAHDFINQFQNKREEDLTALLVLEKYFDKTGQNLLLNSSSSV